MIWRFNHKIRSVPLTVTPNRQVEIRAPAVIHWSGADRMTTEDAVTHDTGIGIHIVDLPIEALAENKNVVCTVYWPGTDRWQGENLSFELVSQM